MSIPIRPEEIEIPDDDPFRHDLLERKKPAEVLTGVVSSFRGPGVVAIDAAWGTGKTTFLRMWSRRLKNDGFTIVEFNAWDTDFAADPFLALSTELQGGLELCAPDIPSDAMEGIKKWSKKILRHGVPELVRLAVGSVPIVGAVSGKVTESIMDQFTESRVSSYTATKQAVSEFRSALGCAASAIFDSTSSKPLVVIIDELDRCRPTYAVELLETAKHVFSVDHVVFVLAINRTELVHSIRAVYGDSFDADTYLRRFIDADIQLPRPNRERLIAKALEVAGLEEVVSVSKDRDARLEASLARDVLVDILQMSFLDVRTMLQAVHRLGLVLRSIPEKQHALLFAASIATIVLAHNKDAYDKLSRRTASDKEVIQAVRNLCPTHDWNSNDATVSFEVTLIRLVMDQARIETRDAKIPLFDEYRRMLRETPELEDGAAEPIEIRRARRIQRHVELRRNGDGPRGLSLSGEFNFVFGRLDMISGVAPRNPLPRSIY